MYAPLSSPQHLIRRSFLRVHRMLVCYHEITHNVALDEWTHCMGKEGQQSIHNCGMYPSFPYTSSTTSCQPERLSEWPLQVLPHFLYTTCPSPTNITWDPFPMGFPCGPAIKNPPAKPETSVGSVGLEDRLEKEVTTHSSILAWEIPRTEEPGGLQSRGLQQSQT